MIKQMVLLIINSKILLWIAHLMSLYRTDVVCYWQLPGLTLHWVRWDKLCMHCMQVSFTSPKFSQSVLKLHPWREGVAGICSPAWRICGCACSTRRKWVWPGRPAGGPRTNWLVKLCRQVMARRRGMACGEGGEYRIRAVLRSLLYSGGQACLSDNSAVFSSFLSTTDYFSQR